MLAVDTNVLRRAVVDEPGNMDQCHAARCLIQQAVEIFVPQVVQVELVWVLERASGFERSEVALVLEQLGDNAAIHLQCEDAFRAAFGLYQKGGDFADGIIATESARVGVELATFDRKLARLEGVRLVSTTP